MPATHGKSPEPGATPGEDVETPEAVRFSPEEEAELLSESNTHKLEANSLFSSGKFTAAIGKYDEAVAICPNYLDYELAVLKSNIAACHLKLQEWKEAVTNATAALDNLDRLDRVDKEKAKSGQNPADKEAEKCKEEEDEVEEEIISAGASKASPAPPPKQNPNVKKRRDDIVRIRAKALMRRGRARSELAGWSNLEGALEDYKQLATMSNLSPADRKTVQSQLRRLPPLAKAAQEKETAEMWGKLKDLGNGILKPFGLSTDSFNMVKDEKTGGYSLNFQGGGGSG